MRYLIVSDIHANWEALEATVEDAASAYDEIVACGDFVGYGADPNRVVEWARSSAQTFLRGNHDKAGVGLIDLEWFNDTARISAEWTRKALSRANLDWVRALPQGPLKKDGFDAVHGSPADEDEYLITRADIAGIITDLEAPVTFFGHTHLQGAYLCHRNGVKKLAPPRSSETERILELEPDAPYMINPGSVGQPRDGDPRAAYALYDSDRRFISLRRVPYPVGRAQNKIRKAGLPGVLADRLSVGR